MSTLGDRIKRYEAVYDQQLTPRSCVVVRVDGRAFHTYCRRATRPFDNDIIEAMRYATILLSQEMQGFRLAYTQSDEASFLLADFDQLDTQGWFDYSVNKIVSIAASTFSGWFNHYIDQLIPGGRPERFPTRPAVFDARAFVVPRDDAANVFVWRQRDWARNSLQMLARAHFSHRQLHGKNREDIHEMLHGVGVNWADLDPVLKNGTFYSPYPGNGRRQSSDRLSYDEIAELAGLVELASDPVPVG